MILQRFALLFTFIFTATLLAQTTYEEINSTILGEARQIKIQLPRNYDATANKTYPVVLVMDGDYLFEPVAGMIDYNSYWEEMPEAIVVGINMDKTRQDDTFYGDESFLPEESGAAFFEFLGLELMTYMDENYKTTNFRIAVGHDLTANFMNYYLMKSDPLFQGYISLSPDLAPSMDERLVARLTAVDQRTFYYLATGTEDISSLRDATIALDTQIKAIENDNLRYYFDNFEGATHYSLVGRGIPKALETIFLMYRPISKKEYKEQLLDDSNSPYDYLLEKYATVENLFGLKGKIRVNDFVAVATALDRRGDWEELERLGELARKHYPETMLGNYYLARAKEEIGEPKKAMRLYQNAFLLDEISFITKDMMLDKAEQIRKDFGFK